MSAAKQLPLTTSPIVDAFAFLGIEDDEPIELRALETPKFPRTAGLIAPARDIASIFASQPDPKGTGVYFVANALHSQVSARTIAQPRWSDVDKGQGATDRDITHRRAIMIDCDVARPKGTSTTDEQKATSREVAIKVRDFLISEGVPIGAIALVDSGNGYQLWIAIERIAASGELTDLIGRLLAALNDRFGTSADDNDGGIKIDRTVANEARLFPLPGTMKRKGNGTARYPHRMVTIELPPTLGRLSTAALTELVNRIAPEQPKPAKSTADKPRSDLDRAKWEVPVSAVLASLGMSEHECPRGHEAGADAYGNGVKCHHDSCRDNNDGMYSTIDLVMHKRGVQLNEATAHVLKIGGLEPSKPATDKQTPVPWTWETLPP